MFESLSEKLDKVFKKLRSYGKLDEGNIKDALREVRIALLEADVNFKVAKSFIETIRERAVGKEVLKSLTPGQQVVKIVHEEMIHLLGDSQKELSIGKSPSVIMMTGLQGSGKTTTCGKIASWLNENKKSRVLLVAADTYRPAAQEQLAVIGKELNTDVFIKKGLKPLEICIEGYKKAATESYDIVILDTAGRLHIDEEMMDELKDIKNELKPSETLLVIDSMTGQEAVNVATQFNKAINIDGVVLTKFDGDARGGAALSVKAVTGKPIKFIGVGEKLSDIEPFHPDRVASRILGMGDVLTLIEKAQKSFEEKSAVDLEKKIKTDSFTLDDFLTQLKQIKKMGSLEKIISMIPGINKANAPTPDEGQLARTEAIINSMTKKERFNHTLINGSRKQRIANGSGTTVSDVNKLIKQFSQMKKMMKKFHKQFSNGNFKADKGLFSNFSM